MKPGNRKLAIALTRVSTDDQKLGPEVQRAAIQSWAKREGVKIVAWHHEDVSGGAPIDERPGLQAALQGLAEHRAGLLVVHKRDRLARDIVAAAMITRLVERVGGIVATADGMPPGNSPEATMMRGMLDLFAQYERAIIVSRTRAALAAKKARGEVTGRAPFGMRVSADGRHLEEDPDEAAVVERVGELLAQGMLQKDVVTQLAAEGARSRAGTPLTATQVSRIARRPGWAPS
jgi:DNA invertase Pin-like site-specific DNA recombinase